MAGKTVATLRNSTATREMQLSDVARRLAYARGLTAQSATERDMMIRRFGIAHPRSIAVSQRLDRARDEDRRLTMLHNRFESELDRAHARDRTRLRIDHTTVQ